MATPDSPSETAAAPAKIGPWPGLMQSGSRRRRLALATVVYLIAGAIFAVFAGPERLSQHTPFNHYALLADAWLHGRQDLPHGPPPYAQNNDFAEFNGKTYISFPRSRPC